MRNLAVCVAGVAFAVSSLFAQSVPRKAPELAFSIPGHGQQLLSQYRGKVVALEFIFTTCPHCQAAAKLMTKFQKQYGAQGLQVIDVAVNQNADLLVSDFARDFHVNFPVGWALRQQAASFMNFASGYFVVPQLALIDRKGNIRYQTPATETPAWDKLMKVPSLKQKIQELLTEGSSASAHPTSKHVSRKAS